MTIKKPSIPAIQLLPPDVASILKPMKENIEIITGARGGALSMLAANATNSQIIAKINEIVARLNQAGA